MGSYLSSLSYIKSGYQPENNNAMNDNIAEKIDQPRVAPKKIHLKSVNVPSVLATKRLQNQYKKDSSFMLNLWQRLNSLFNYQNRFAPPEIDISENCQSTSFEVNSQISSSEESNRTIFAKPACQRLCGKGLELQESDEFFSLRIKTKLQSPVDCFNRSRETDRTFANFIFQRLDSGIEDTPLAFSTRTQIDLHGLYLTTKVTMADNQQCCAMDRNLKMVYHKSISFFIDIKDPLRQRPLCEDYRFSTFGECDSMFSYDSMFSDHSSGNSNENCADDDFIFFEEDILDKETDYDFNFTLNNSCTPAELSCCVGANSTNRVDVCLNTSPVTVHTTCPRKLASDSSMSVKVDISPNSKTRKPAAKCSNDDGGSDSNCSSTSEVTSEKTYCTRLQTSTNYFDASSSTTSEKAAKLGDNGSAITDCCVVSCITPGKKKSRKKVCFEKEDDLVVIYEMRHWDFAYREARKGHWELAAVDRCRFRRRIQELDSILTPCLKRKLGLIEET